MSLLLIRRKTNKKRRKKSKNFKYTDKYAEEKLKNTRLETITRMIKRGDSVQSILELDFIPEEYSLAKNQLSQITTQ